ncbi:MAG: redox-sensing transcriptional repressor Rex [Firmicutes bacterium]|nr:redox-sensing transcriptional repressor Rex [Bacillota bacterium]
MAMQSDVSMPVVRRLPRYYRFLGELKKAGYTRISSRELSQRMGLTASQIRQDFNCFGGFGQQGYGYNIELLQSEIGRILGLDRLQRLIIVGAGNLGRAIANQIAFEERGFKLIGLFDAKESVVGQMVAGMPIRNVADLDEFCRAELPTVAVLTVPFDAAAAIGDQLVKLGIKGLWNFSHYDFGNRYENVSVENVHLGDSLMTLRYMING